MSTWRRGVHTMRAWVTDCLFVSDEGKRLLLLTVLTFISMC